MKVKRYHITALSNIIIGYDKYKGVYSKKNIINSTYPGEFYLLKEGELSIGFDKVSKLIEKLDLSGNEPIILETEVDNSELFPNSRNGKGEYIKRDWIKIYKIYIKKDQGIKEALIEEVVAKAYSLYPIQKFFDKLKPRSVSILPVANGCQANCNFCFSEASISDDQPKGQLENYRIEEVLQAAREMGASRAVITGGGEPGILKMETLTSLITFCSKYFIKTILITNGYFLTKSLNVSKCINALQNAGLSIIAISRHHYDPAKNFKIMGLEIPLPNFKNENFTLKLRLICVLQKGGIETKEDVLKYIDWAHENGISSICFKELYISSSIESVYYNKQANDYCKSNQVSLCVITELANEMGWIKVDELPWGSPIYKMADKSDITIAAYTEPSVSWELQNGICRSWNLMADGSCYASLENRESRIL